MQRYFVSNELYNETYAHIKEDYHHIKNVMRMHKEDKIIVCNESGSCFLGEIASFDNTTVLVNKVDEIRYTELDIDVTIAIGLMNNKKMDLLVQKLTELGVRRIIPISMKRSIVKNKDSKIERWKKIAKEASEQSHRNLIPIIEEVTKLEKINIDNYEQCLFAYEKSNNKYTFRDSVLNNDNILIVIGPEGGIDDSEVNFMKENNFIEVSLGKRILRAETAPLFVMSAVTYIKELG
ncbi:RsmE family RNA methyltransferase [Mycoplasmatota bacterium WC44]